MAKVTPIRKKGASASRFHHHADGQAIRGLPDPAPCPFCRSVEYGGIVTNETENHPEDTTYHVACDSCGCDGPSAMSLREAAELWNKANNVNVAGALNATVKLHATYLDLMRVDSMFRVIEAALRGDAETEDQLEIVHYEFQLAAMREIVRKAFNALDEAGFSSADK